MLRCVRTHHSLLAPPRPHNVLCQDERLQELMDGLRGRFKAAVALLGLPQVRRHCTPLSLQRRPGDLRGGSCFRSSTSSVFLGGRGGAPANPASAGSLSQEAFPSPVAAMHAGQASF